MKKKHICLIALGVAAILLLCGILPPGISILTSIPSGHSGILTTYGKVENKDLAPGLYFKKPWQKLITMDNRVRTTVISTGVKGATVSDSAETKDRQLIPQYHFEVQHKLIKGMAYSVYANYGENYVDRVIIANANQIIKEAFATYYADEIVTAKSQMPEFIKDELNKITSPIGVEIDSVIFVTYDFTPEYTSILEQRALLNAQLENNKLQQQNETIAAQTQYDVAVKQAEKEAETQRIAAENANQIAIANANAKAETDKINAENEAYVTRTKAEAEKFARLAAAEAEKAELEAKSSGLNEFVIQQEWIERWNGELVPSFDGSNGVSFTDLTDVVGSYFASDPFGE